MSYRHGVFTQEVPTSLLTPVHVDSAMPVIVGTAPVHNLANEVVKPINEPVLIYNMQEFVSRFGELKEGDDKSAFTLYQAAEIYLTRYKVAPLVAINVFDPARHKNAENAQNAEDTPDVSAVTKADIIGTTTSAGRTGLQLVEEVFPRFRLLPGQVLAPKYSSDPSIALAIGSASNNINGHFRATGICEVPDSVAYYSDAPAWLNDNNLQDVNILCMFGSCVYGGVTEPGSIHLAGVIGQRDAENDNIPYYSPSNKKFLCEGMVHAGKALHLTSTEAAYLNGNGIVTGLNMIGGLVAWGDQTTVYPANTDVKDSSIPIRRMFNWIGNTLILTSWQKVSSPTSRRLIETVQDTFNMWLNGLKGREYILGGRVEFEMVDNPLLDLMNGIVRWHVYVTPPQAARELVFIMEYDPEYLKTLYGVAS